ncbi:MAG: galactokinase, partial [Pirellulales bacterium]
APGRVNLIGEHTDYNGGYVLPMALDRYVIIAAGPAGEEPEARVFSVDRGESAPIRVRSPIEPGSVTWSSYLQGVVAGFVARGLTPPSFKAVVDSTVPVGGGLSSSAALEVATATLLESITGTRLDLVEKALLCQKAEHEFAGVPCGIMDQFSSVMCQANMLMLLDCRSQKVEFVPFDDASVSVVVANTNVKHELTGGEYAERRSTCEAAADVLGVSTLRDADSGQLESAREKLEPIQHRRARHVIREIERTVAAAAAVRENDWATMGELMYGSHASLRDDYEVSCEELDLMVEIAKSIGPPGGVMGSRMTGGGFGGCTVSLVRTEQAASFSDELARRYQEATHIEPTIFATRPSRGALVMEV